MKSNYKWFILVLAMLAYGIVTGADRMALPVLFKEISLDLNLNMVSIGTIWGMDPLAGVFVCMLGGLAGRPFWLKTDPGRNLYFERHFLRFKRIFQQFHFNGRLYVFVWNRQFHHLCGGPQGCRGLV